MDIDGYSREVVLDHARDPRGQGLLDVFTDETSVVRESCGDRLHLRAVLGTREPAGERIKSLGFLHGGCALSLASASMMVEAVKGARPEEASALSSTFRISLRENSPSRLQSIHPDLADLVSFTRVPLRQDCVLMAWNALDALLATHTGRRTPDSV